MWFCRKDQRVMAAFSSSSSSSSLDHRSKSPANWRASTDASQRKLVVFVDFFLSITLFLGRKGKLFAALPIKRYPKYQRFCSFATDASEEADACSVEGRTNKRPSMLSNRTEWAFTFPLNCKSSVSITRPL